MNEHIECVSVFIKLSEETGDICVKPKIDSKRGEYCEREQQNYMNCSDTRINASDIDCARKLEAVDYTFNGIKVHHSNTRIAKYGFYNELNGKMRRKRDEKSSDCDLLEKRTKQTLNRDEREATSSNERNSISVSEYLQPFTFTFTVILVTQALLAFFISLVVVSQVLRLTKRKENEQQLLNEIRIANEWLKVNNENFGNSNSTIGTYKSETVFIRKISEKVNALKPNTICILREAYKLRKDVANSFIGFIHCETGCNNISVGFYLVWEFGFKSLYQIINDPKFEMDFASKTSVLYQIAKGMRYIHESSINFHGSLSSHYCVVNARLSVKIIEFGTIKIYESEAIILKIDCDENLLWIAPELLRLTDTQLVSHLSKAADIYSFAIIASEIITFRKPYASFDLPLEIIVEQLKNPPPFIRPKIIKETEFADIFALTTACWDENPNLRPSFADILEAFKRLNYNSDSKLTSITRKSSFNSVVKDKKDENDMRNLLHRMLPIPVANLLKVGIEVPPEKFDLVTIMFSDIVGFTTISAFSEPMEVINLLNDLYTIMDTAILTHDVYKVETIGDAYMLVSGLPTRNVDHAEQIASAALEILEKSSHFKIRHMPKIPFNIRIGINSGPVVAGVVGKTMPRYCLFGDTVNVASRMESTGRAFAIHVSKSTEALLREAGNYEISYRGDILLKGKGKQPTYWLIGKHHSQHFPLPADNESDDNHGFADDSLFRQNTV